MKRFGILLLLLLMLTSCMAASDGKSAQQKSEEKSMNVIGYITVWNYDYCFDKLDWKNLTHVNLAFVNPSPDGKFTMPIKEADWYDLLDMAHSNGVMVFASLGGWGGSVNYPAIFEDKKALDSMNENLMEFLTEYGFDGLDLDIEGDVEESFWAHYEDWVFDLGDMLADRGLFLSTAVGKWYAHHITDDTLKQFDLVNVMAYDAGAPDHSSYEFAVENIEYFTKRGIAPEQLVLGVPFYGRNSESDGMDYNKIISADKGNYTRNEYNGYVYNNADLIRKKCELAKDLGGIMIWELSADMFDKYSLLKIIGDYK